MAKQQDMITQKNILIVDDDLSIRTLLEHFVGMHHHVKSFDGGMQALVWMQQGNIPDLIIADLMMPDLDGFSFLSNVRSSAFFRHIPVVMLSGMENSKEKIKSLKLGANDYMVKPFNPEELIMRVNNLLTLVENSAEYGQIVR